MTEQQSPTPAANPTGTEAPVAPSATPPSNAPGATEETITIKTSDYNNLISQRDKGNQEAKSSKTALEQMQETLQGHDALLEEQYRDKAINEFLTNNKDKYPDLNFDDFSNITSPDQIEAEAIRIQRRLDDHAQAKVLDIQNNNSPTLTPEQKEQKIAELKASGDPDALEKVLALRMGL